MFRRMRTAIGLAAVGLVAACSGSTERPGTGVLVVRLTDAPGEQIESAEVWISKVYLLTSGDSAGGRVAVSDTAAMYDLMDLQGGATALLGTVTIPVGDYDQMRLVVDSAQVTLKAPLTFGDGSSTKSLKTPSGQQSGIKVNFDAPVHVSAGETILVVDFDVSRNFVFTGPPGAPHGVIFTPVLHATAMDIAGSIAGTVGPASSKAQLFAIVGTDTVASALADTTTGAYVLRYLDPRVSPFTVAATATGFTTQTKTVPLRTAQDTTGVDFTLTP